MSDSDEPPPPYEAPPPYPGAGAAKPSSTMSLKITKGIGGLRPLSDRPASAGGMPGKRMGWNLAPPPDPKLQEKGQGIDSAVAQLLRDFCRRNQLDTASARELSLMPPEHAKMVIEEGDLDRDRSGAMINNKEAYLRARIRRVEEQFLGLPPTIPEKEEKPLLIEGGTPLAKDTASPGQRALAAYSGTATTRSGAAQLRIGAGAGTPLQSGQRIGLLPSQQLAQTLARQSRPVGPVQGPVAPAATASQGGAVAGAGASDRRSRSRDRGSRDRGRDRRRDSRSRDRRSRDRRSRDRRSRDRRSRSRDRRDRERERRERDRDRDRRDRRR